MDGFRSRFVHSAAGSEYLDVQEPFGRSVAAVPSGPVAPASAVVAHRLYRSLPEYFRVLERLVKPGGRVVIQAITMPHKRMRATRNSHTWIQKYIFPGGLIPSVGAILGITERQTRLRAVDMPSLRRHHAETLRLRRERFTQHRITPAHMGFDEAFTRMWELYPAYVEAGFRSGYLDVHQWTFVSAATP
jgi:cyclopropane-fatty-acyl-phospholipid synthase